MSHESKKVARVEQPRALPAPADTNATAGPAPGAVTDTAHGAMPGVGPGEAPGVTPAPAIMGNAASIDSVTGDAAFSELVLDDLDRDALHVSDVEVTMVGAGRAGSMLALVCGMLGIAVRVYDADRLGPENQGLQVYRKKDVAAGRHKVQALRSLVQSIAPKAQVRVHKAMFEAAPGQPRSPIVILAVDTMETRRRLWNALKDQPGVLRVLDVRLGRALVQLHDVRPQEPDDVSMYEASLYDDASAAADDCTDEATSHAAAAAAALVGGAVRAFVEGLPRPRFIGLDVDRALWAAGR